MSGIILTDDKTKWVSHLSPVVTFCLLQIGIFRAGIFYNTVNIH